MLERLSINNIVLIDKAEIDFSQGFTVLTGETGAGKSILLDSISLLMGARSGASIIRAGEQQASVYAEFDISNNDEIKNILKENGFEAEDQLTIKRIIASDGKAKAYINDSAASAGNLKEVGNLLIEIHGQSEQSNLLSSKYHQAIIDDYAGIENDVEKLSNIYEQLKIANDKRTFLINEKERLAKDQEYFEFVLSELNSLNIQENEEEELAERRTFLMNSGKLYDVLQNALSAMTGDNDVVRNLLNAQRTLGRNPNLIPDDMRQDVENAAEEIEKAMVAAGSAANAIEALIDGFDNGEGRLEDIEERLFKIREISRKYHKPSTEFTKFAEEIDAKLKLITGNDSEITLVEKHIKELRAQYVKSAQAISASRKKAAEKLEKSIVNELKPLKMEGCRFKVEINEKAEDNWNASGMDDIRFKVSTNPGQPFNDIAKVASGGELSRLMLALKVVISGVRSVPTIIFDEIDTGIGGSVADSVGERLERLGRNLQVLVVTHQPQVASKGHHHLKISKGMNKGSFKTSIKELDNEERTEEIARMLSGAEITEEARKAAEKLRA